MGPTERESNVTTAMTATTALQGILLPGTKKQAPPFPFSLSASKNDVQVHKYFHMFQSCSTSCPVAALMLNMSPFTLNQFCVCFGRLPSRSRGGHKWQSPYPFLYPPPPSSILMGVTGLSHKYLVSLKIGASFGRTHCGSSGLGRPLRRSHPLSHNNVVDECSRHFDIKILDHRDI